jgi:hypothetical protein
VAGPRGGAQWIGEWRWGAQRGEREGEAFGVELTEDIGVHEVGGARGHRKLLRGQKNNSAGDDRGSDRSWQLLRGGGGKTGFSFGPWQCEDKGAQGRRTWRRQGTRSGVAGDWRGEAVTGP